MSSIYWTGICGKARNQAISDISAIINHHGYLTHFQLFSDVSLSMIIEIEERNVDALYEGLTKYLRIDDFVYINSNSAKERTILFNITFTQGRGTLRIEVPAVPG